MAWFKVRFEGGFEWSVNIATADAEAAMAAAYRQLTAPIWCRIHDEIADRSDAPVGSMGNFHPSAPLPVSAAPMREVYMGGGYCLVPMERAA